MARASHARAGGRGAIGSDRIRLGRLDLSFLGLLFAFGLWVLLSATWSSSLPARCWRRSGHLAYVGVTLLALLVVRRRTAPVLVAGVLAGVTLVSGYAFLTRVLPDRFTRFDTLAGYRLTDPIGYWNGLGIFAAMGVLLALGFAARAGSASLARFASALPVVLISTLFFTFSRGAWVALAVGLVVGVLVDPRRLQLLATALVLAPWSALAVWLCVRADALTTVGSSLPRATSEGRSLLLSMVVLSVASGVSGFVLAKLNGRMEIGVRVRRAFAGLLVVLALAGIAVAWVHVGSPISAASSAWDRFRAPYKEQTTNNLTQRLFDLSSGGRVDLWRTSLDDFRAHELTGTGAGTFAYSWAARRPAAGTAKDAHSLYIETLGELGLVGLGLLAAFLAIPVIAAIRVRASPVLPGALAAFAAWTAHAAVDWDWELTGVTLVALLSGAALVASARDDDDLAGIPVALVVTSVSVLLAAFAIVTALGNVPLGRARDALASSDYALAKAEARRARRWAPWSAEPCASSARRSSTTASRRRRGIRCASTQEGADQLGVVGRSCSRDQRARAENGDPARGAAQPVEHASAATARDAVRKSGGTPVEGEEATRVVRP